MVVTGGSGFIGTSLVRTLIDQGIRVAIVDLNEPRVDGVEYFMGDITDPAVFERALTTPADTIFHLAAKTSVLASVKDPQGVFQTNVIGTHNVLEACRINSIPSVVMASTNAVVGNSDREYVDENSTLRPLTPYGSSKAASECLAWAYSASYGVAVASVRLTNVYGKDMWAKDSIVPRLFRFATGEGSFSIYGDGAQVRDYVFVDDVVAAFISLSERVVSATVPLGLGRSVSVTELVSIVSSITNTQLTPTFLPPQSGEMRGVSISLAKAEELSIAPKTSLEHGLEVAWNDFSKSE